MLFRIKKMKNYILKEYVPPIIKVHQIEMEYSISATSVTRINNKIEEEWIEEEITFDKIEW